MPTKANLTIDDIARELGVSKTTVSRAISGKGRISAATRERVHAYIETHHYKPNASAKSLAERRTCNLALVLPRDAALLQEALYAVTDEAFAHNHNVILCLSASQLLQTLDYRKADGVLLVCTAEKDPIVQMVIHRGIPFVTLDPQHWSSETQARAACRELIHTLTQDIPTCKE